MNPGQEQFYAFFIERVVEEKKDDAKLLLEESFKKQDEGSFDRAYFMELMPKMMGMIKPEAVNDVNEAMKHFASRF